MTQATARITLPKIPLFRKEANGTRRVTGMLLPFLLEQLVATGATEIVVNDAWRYKEEISKLPKIYEQYLRLSDKEGRAIEISNKIFEPIFDEIGIRKSGSGFTVTNNKTSDDITLSAIMAYSDYSDFTSAVLCKSQVHLNINRINSNLLKLLNNLKGNESRANISCFIPIFNSYKDIKIPGVKLLSNPNNHLSERFHDILRSTEFNILSEKRYNLGTRRCLDIVVAELKHRTRKLLSLRPAKPLIGYSSALAAVAINAPIPTSDVVESFLAEDFMPPIVDLTTQIKDAHKFLLKNLEDDSAFVSPYFSKNKISQL